jgi:hypothetical protein
LNTPEPIPTVGLTGEEVADLFRRVILRELKIIAIGNSWKQVYAGNVRVRIDGYEFVIFNDCDELDYVDSAAAPDGRRGDFDGWSESNSEPVSLLTKYERSRLEGFLESAPVEPEESSTSDQ